MTQFVRPAGHEAGVYRVRDVDGRLLYVGVGSDPNRRLASHARKKDWWPDVDPDLTTVEWFKTYGAALKAERRAIETEEPVHNQTYSTINPHWSVGRPTLGQVAVAAGYVPVEDLRKNLSEYVNRAKVCNERFVVSRHGAPVSALVSYEFLRRAEEAMAEVEDD